MVATSRSFETALRAWFEARRLATFLTIRRFFYLILHHILPHPERSRAQ
jgi:hypothetical protein